MLAGFCEIMQTAARHSGSVARNGGVHNVNAVRSSLSISINRTAATCCTVAVESGIVNIGVIRRRTVEINSAAVTVSGKGHALQNIAVFVLDFKSLAGVSVIIRKDGVCSVQAVCGIERPAGSRMIVCQHRIRNLNRFCTVNRTAGRDGCISGKGTV